ncbi:MAG: glycosyltransferase [Rhodobacteraceae bacterium]|nr:glycosyltransferase [Paracoccaceae bacterium]
MRILAIMPCQPFPAYNGQTHRLSHVVRSLARKHQVSLACFVEPDQVNSFPEKDRALFSQVKLSPIAEPSNNFIAKWLRRFGKHPLDVVRLSAPDMHAHIDSCLEDFDPEVILVGDPALTQYVPGGKSRVVALDYVCEATLQFERMRDLSTGLERTLWEARRRKFVRFLKGMDDTYDAVFLNSREDVDALARYWSADKLLHVPNGLELSDYPRGLAAPVHGQMIYPGSVLYPPNRDAVEWFAMEILPRIRARHPGAELRVTGAYDETAPQAEGLVYTGRVDDVRKEIAAAYLCVVPLRLGAGGARFKVIESMALGTPVVGTAIGVEGLELSHAQNYMAAESANEIADACTSLLEQPDLRRKLSVGARKCIEDTYNWNILFEQIEQRIVNLHEGLKS